MPTDDTTNEERWFTNHDETFTVTVLFSVSRGGWEVHTHDTITGEFIEFPNTDYRTDSNCSAFTDIRHAWSLASAIVMAYETGVGRSH